ncbi:hypothetical protein VSDG_04517 [Cytospora chrysosperma]|uniref:Uncharacterized protein n=1 Tax=Cytospora chrysosperma TaxID=252740 RepID=A0A423W4J2_CYTCH|nr:hypothetical protein VSDG_04517 [Valsa sordida]
MLQDLPFCLCQPGPEHVDGIPSKVRDPDCDWIKQNQIDWLTSISQALRKAREANCEDRGVISKHSHLSLAFLHIPLPE